MQEDKLLSDIANIRLGLAFKKSIKDLGEDGTCYLIQSKDITFEGHIDREGLARVEPEISPNNHFLEIGDILLRLKGPSFFATVFDDEFSIPTLVTNHTAIIRCISDYVSPYYLQWYLNSALGQHYFSLMNEGTGITRISGKSIANMKIELPSREEQQKIEIIRKNWLSQKAAHNRIIENGDMYFGQLCMRIQNGKLHE